MKPYNWHKLLRHFLFPPLWIMLSLSVLSGAGMVMVFGNGMEQSPLAYVVYILSAYTLTVMVMYGIRVLPSQIRQIKTSLDGIPLAHRYLTDPRFKVQVSLMANVAYNTVFAAFNLLSGLLNRSAWMVAIGVYHFLLSALRLPLLRYIYRDTGGASPMDLRLEYRCYGRTGAGMLVLNLSLSAIFALILLEDQTYSYPGLMIFAAAAYTFGSLTVAIVHLVRYRRYKSPVLSASRTIQFTAAAVSMMSLETAMLNQFSTGTEQVEFNNFIKTLTAIGIWLLVTGLSVYMIKRARRALKQMDPDAASPHIKN